MRTPYPLRTKRQRGLAAFLFSLLVTFTLLFALAPAAQAAGSSWIRVNTTAQGQLLTKLQEKLVSDYGQTAGSYDYSVVQKLAVSGTLNAQDYTDLRNATYAGDDVEKLDLSGVVDPTVTQPLSGMTAMTDVFLPPVGAYMVANPFNGDANLKNVVVAVETYRFGSTTTFNGVNNLQRIVFLHPTKPPTDGTAKSLTEATFSGSNNADPVNRAVTAVVPDKTRGDYDKNTFTQYFANVTEAANAGDLSELENVIAEAEEIDEVDAAAPFRWTLLQQAITEAQSVVDETAPTASAVYNARLVLRTAIDRIGMSDLGLSFKVTHGAAVTLSWKFDTWQHYAEFVEHPLAKVDSLSDDDYDIYVPATTVPNAAQNIASAVIHGQTDKVAKIFTSSAATANTQFTLNLEPLEGRQDTALLIPGLGAGDDRNLYTNLDDTGVLNLDVGEHFDLDTFRTFQGQLEQVQNMFVEPDYTFDVSGDSISTSDIGYDGRRQLRITAQHPGVSVIKITYGPLHYLANNDNGTPGNTNWSFNGIDPQNTGLAVVNVGGDAATFDTGINVRNELDTYYFDKTVGTRDFTFTPAPGTVVRVHDPLNVSAWGSGWHSYEPAPNGSYTVKLKGGRNIVELTNDGKVQYRVLRAKGVEVSITNTTNPGQSFIAGDVAKVSITGVEGGIDKLSGIYNPAFMAGTKGKLTYYDGESQLVSNEALQYQTAITTFNVNYTYTGDGDKALNGDMFIGGLGAEWPYHRQIPLEGKPANLAAVAIGPYHFGGAPPIYVHGDQVSTSADAPGAPTGLQVTYGDGSAELSWTAPTSTGGLPIVGYSVRYSSDGGANWETESFGTDTIQTLTGLVNGTEYEVQVAALNSSGMGAYTTSQTVTPRTVPGVPRDLTLTSRHNGLDLSWTTPDSGGSEIIGYRIRHSSDAGQNWTTQDYGTATEATLTDLIDGTAYEVQVAAVNAEGTGNFTASAVATPKAPETPMVSLSADESNVRVGDTVRLTWSADGAETIVASGDWSGTKTTSGSEEMVVDHPGDFTFTLTATGQGGTATATAKVKSTLASVDLTVKAPTRLVHVGRRATVAVAGLAAGEPYRVTIAGLAVGAGKASAAGSLSTAVAVPAVLRDGTVPVEVVGSADDRVGSANLRIVSAKRLTVKVKKAKVRKGMKQRVSVSGLAAGEPVRIVYKGKKIAALKASAKGTVAKAFKVGKARGTKKIKVFGVTKDRKGLKAFKVVR